MLFCIDLLYFVPRKWTTLLNQCYLYSVHIIVTEMTPLIFLGKLNRHITETLTLVVDAVLTENHSAMKGLGLWWFLFCCGFFFFWKVGVHLYCLNVLNILHAYKVDNTFQKKKIIKRKIRMKIYLFQFSTFPLVQESHRGRKICRKRLHLALYLFPLKYAPFDHWSY